MSGWDMREDRLDDLLRDALVVDPPPAVRAGLLAAVLDASTLPAVTPTLAPQAQPHVVQPSVVAAGPSPLVYALLGALLALYVGLVTSFGGLLGDGGWLVVLARQITIANSLLGGIADGLLGLDPESLVPWLALVPVVWLLLERDRAEGRLRS